jgi:hypothetical protein
MVKYNFAFRIHPGTILFPFSGLWMGLPPEEVGQLVLGSLATVWGENLL